ncbi:Hemolysin, chromosomal [Aquimixticola soesokkakensis]|uniref:Hemolysin, chromosomal n=1 Tax=Aquimixticola soesokkakensis TaxID=1519096 RepID=A0A1Y5T076_9RHOB|nr:calcium-binding protein [Aquimixticola soesokkakensis]SLN49026.1 Hemolysin, chromosomal [Aquimixticola soesokkakensis]
MTTYSFEAPVYAWTYDPVTESETQSFAVAPVDLVMSMQVSALTYTVLSTEADGEEVELSTASGGLPIVLSIFGEWIMFDPDEYANPWLTTLNWEKDGLSYTTTVLDMPFQSVFDEVDGVYEDFGILFQIAGDPLPLDDEGFDPLTFEADYNATPVATTSWLEGDALDLFAVLGATMTQDDVVVADDNDNVIGVGAGKDTVFAGGGDDVIWAGVGADTIYAGDGDDRVIGGGGQDYAELGDGNDTYEDEADGDDWFAQDEIHGGAGHDNIFAGGGRDTVYGGSGDDYIDGWTGDDLLIGNQGDDTLLGYDGNDRIFAGIGNDDLSGEAGDDLLNGFHGDDLLNGGLGNDTMTGGLGIDTFMFFSDRDEGNDVITDFDVANDVLALVNLSEVPDEYTLTVSDTFATLDLAGGTSVTLLGAFTQAEIEDTIVFNPSFDMPPIDAPVFM